eukprot:scaffold260454_cov20-Tisochrysis_lutea.AAC.1
MSRPPRSWTSISACSVGCPFGSPAYTSHAGTTQALECGVLLGHGLAEGRCQRAAEDHRHRAEGVVHIVFCKVAGAFCAMLCICH